MISINLPYLWNWHHRAV